jgi:hypothetical protein
MRTRLLLAAAVGIACVTAASAAGDGGPSPGVVQGGGGIARGSVRYVAIPTGQNTVLETISRRTGRVLRWAVIDGNYGIPQVAFDGSTDGLSHDGRTLVLGDVTSSAELKKSSSFAVVDVRRAQLRSTITLQGDFAFDALSPGARMLYLIEHVSADNPRKYQVRAYDLGARRLLQRVVIDKSSWEEVMQGMPFTRATSSDGRWVYTLYAGGEYPFVHALDTQSANARCIDLPKSWNRLDVGGLRLRLGKNGTLLVRHWSGGRPLAVIDVQTLRVLKVVRNP